MRIVRYERFEFHQDTPDEREASLAEFVLDVPYLVARGVIPPLHILNEVTRTGGGDAGMSPGAVWDPFEVTPEEYQELLVHLSHADLEELRRQHRARFVPDRVIVDETLHESPTHLDWIRNVHRKYPGQ